MHREKHDIVFFAVTAGMIFAFAGYAFFQHNEEFVFYASVMVFLVVLLMMLYQKLAIPHWLLWMISTLILLHLLGGTVWIEHTILYEKSVIPDFFRYEHLVHMLSSSVASIGIFFILFASIRVRRLFILLPLAFLGSLGLGAVNEVIEFIATAHVADTFVGGYENIVWDLVYNVFGSSIGIVLSFILYQRQRE